MHLKYYTNFDELSDYNSWRFFMQDTKIVLIRYVVTSRINKKIKLRQK